MLAGIVYRLRTGCQWQALPREFAAGSTFDSLAVVPADELTEPRDLPDRIVAMLTVLLLIVRVPVCVCDSRLRLRLPFAFAFAFARFSGSVLK